MITPTTKYTLQRLPVRKTYTTTIPEIDDHTGGFLASSINTIQAETGLGKSNYLLRLATFYAIAGVKVHYVSTEMNDYEFWPRILAYYKQGKWDDYKFNSEQTKQNALKAFDEFKKDTGDNLLITLDSEVETLATEIDVQMNKHGTEVLIVDHIHQLSSSQRKNSLWRQEEMLKILIDAKNVYKACCLVASQLSKDTVKNGKAPTSQDGKGLSDITENSTHVYRFYMTEKQRAFNFRSEYTPKRGEPALREREKSEPYVVTLWITKTRERTTSHEIEYTQRHSLHYDPTRINFFYDRPVYKE